MLTSLIATVIEGSVNNCKKGHSWIANSGRGGEPVFKRNHLMESKFLMHVHCYQCNARTWLTREQWVGLPTSDLAVEQTNRHV